MDLATLREHLAKWSLANKLDGRPSILDRMVGRPVGRLAPSPTGFLHLGNAWAFLLAWLSVRSQNGILILRNEDLDPQRSRAEYLTALIEDLHWLGLDWDFGPASKNNKNNEIEAEFFFQSQRLGLYELIVQYLLSQGLAYECFCSRKEVRLASAPHLDDALVGPLDDRGAPYSGKCRNLSFTEKEQLKASGRKPSLRLNTQDQSISFRDLVYGEQNFSLAECGGDFILKRQDSVFAYQLATAIDDALMGVTEVVRGRDILPSSPRQILILRLLGFTEPNYCHFPLILDRERARLAKRHHSLSLRSLRASGIKASQIIGLLGFWAGCLEHIEEASAKELIPLFSWDKLGKEDKVLEQF